MESGGLYYAENGDTAQCPLCKLEISEWTIDVKPFDIHKERSPSCPFVHAMLINAVKSISRSENTHMHQGMKTIESMRQRNVFVEVNVMESIRPRTFSHWPHQASLSSAVMVRAGFFKCNMEDRVICLYCNLICHKWLPNTEDPWKIHKTFSPSCFFVKTRFANEETTNTEANNARQEYTTEKIKNNVKSTTGTTKPLPENDLPELVKARLNLPCSKYLLDQGFPLSTIKRCWEDQLSINHDDFAIEADLLIACKILQKQVDLGATENRNIIIPHEYMKMIREKDETRLVTTDPRVVCLSSVQSITLP